MFASFCFATDVTSESPCLHISWVEGDGEFELGDGERTNESLVGGGWP